MDKGRKKITVRAAEVLKAVREPLPQALRDRTVKQFALAFFIAVFCGATAAAYSSPGYLAGTLLSAGLAVMALKTRADYSMGKIAEEVLILTSARKIPARNSTRIIMRTDGERPRYYEFRVGGNLTGKLSPNCPYVVYYHPSDPENLLGYREL